MQCRASASLAYGTTFDLQKQLRGMAYRRSLFLFVHYVALRIIPLFIPCLNFSVGSRCLFPSAQFLFDFIAPFYALRAHSYLHALSRYIRLYIYVRLRLSRLPCCIPRSRPICAYPRNGVGVQLVITICRAMRTRKKNIYANAYGIRARNARACDARVIFA